MKALNWFHLQDRNIFRAINRCREAAFYHTAMGLLTHLGGATATITTTLVLLAAASPEWRPAVFHSAAALVISHVIVTTLKRNFLRQRPYIVIGDSYVVRNPLRDSSFPSGHTTAVFSVTMPYMFLFPSLIILLLPIALLVAISRITIGLHYPSDVIAGMIIGTVTAFLLGLLF
ncbi:phosphatase PAP2 family protein [Alteribacter lacisalsi]|uniref:Phosphatase PAP2 family protein n=1 Tax=Alteribacter lacisalsi TaxID=2045244 RepID=A0A2W0H8P4_9BACI|nr:phosphatase PAP2 family protein [Alteribacter lacisalsi]PYZ97116.1 phosphatase PAP2 family protein [Alteribacter lacisalsi]